MTSAWEWPAAFSVKHPDSSVLDCSSHSSAVRRWYDSSTPASQGQLLELGSTPPCFTLLFKLCVSDGAIQQKRSGEVQTETLETRWKVEVRGRTEIGWKGDMKEGEEWKLWSGGGALSYSRSVIETISCACVCVCCACTNRSRGLVRDRGALPNMVT